MKTDIRKNIIYKYIRYRFKKECLKNDRLESLGQEDKDRICIEVAQKTRKWTLIVGIAYVLAMPVFISWLFVYHYQNPFARWNFDLMESLFPLINGDWGSAMYEKKATFLLICIQGLPLFIIQGMPVFLFILITVNIRLKKKINHILGTAKCE